MTSEDVTQMDFIKQKIMAQHKIGQSTMVLLKHMDSNFQALKDVLIAKGILTDSEYQTAVDSRIGLRLRRHDEAVEGGDIVWVSYTGHIEDTEERFEEHSMPVRVGSGTVVFEKELVGKFQGSVVPFSVKFAKGPNTGKTMHYSVTVEKIKTKLEGATSGRELGEPQGASESDFKADGSGLGDGGDSRLQSVQP